MGKHRPKIQKEVTRRSVLNDEMRKKTGNKGQPAVHKRDTVEYQQKVERVYDYIKQGFASNEIYATLLSEDNDLGEDSFMELMKDAYYFAETSLQKDREFVFQLHMER